MTESFTDYLQNYKFAQGEDLEPEALIVAQKILCNMGLNFLPESFCAFLKKYNGIKAGGCYIFGATVDDDLDIVDQNKKMPKPDNTVLLGYNDFDLLCYDYIQKKYLVADRTDFDILGTYNENELDDALLQIFNV